MFDFFHGYNAGQDVVTCTNEDVELLRQRLLDYYGSAVAVCNMSVYVDLDRVEQMSMSDVVKESVRLGILQFL